MYIVQGGSTAYSRNYVLHPNIQVQPSDSRIAISRFTLIPRLTQHLAAVDMYVQTHTHTERTSYPSLGIRVEDAPEGQRNASDSQGTHSTKLGFTRDRAQ
jgi:hypothetical protein